MARLKAEASDVAKQLDPDRGRQRAYIQPLEAKVDALRSDMELRLQAVETIMMRVLTAVDPTAPVPTVPTVPTIPTVLPSGGADRAFSHYPTAKRLGPLPPDGKLSLRT